MMRLDADDRTALGVIALRASAAFLGGVGVAATLGVAWRVFTWAAGF